MNKLIYSIIFTLLLATTVTALDFYSGDTKVITLDKPYAYYSIVGNSTLIQLEVSSDGNDVLITVGDYVNGSFELVFFDREKEVIYQTSGGGGGSSRTRYIDREVNVTEYVDRLIYINQTQQEEEIDEVVDDAQPQEKSNLAIYLGIAFLVILMAVIIFIIYSNVRGDKN